AAGPNTMLYATSPSSTASSTPDTVTICGTFQFSGVNVRLLAEPAPAAESLDATAFVTAAVGWLSRTTLNWAVPPASLVCRPAAGVTVMPALSLVRLLPPSPRPVPYTTALPILAAGPNTMLYATSPSSTASSTPETATICGTFQFSGVNVRLLAETVPSVVLLEATAMVTAAVGWLSRTTLNSAVPPASLVCRPAAGVTVMPAPSLSRLMADTPGTARSL